MRVRVDRLLFGPNPSGGMNPFVLMSLAYLMLSTSEDPDPVEVTREPDGNWRVHDGRHRVVAAMLAGRRDVLCREVSRGASPATSTRKKLPPA